MYYSEFERTKKMERMLERLAYFSVVLDALVAIATFLVVRGNETYASMLMISNYLLTIEVFFTVMIFVLFVALKHYRKIIDRVAIATFRSRYPIPTYGRKPYPLFKKFLQTVLSLFASNR
jgi:hypothetical protein